MRCHPGSAARLLRRGRAGDRDRRAGAQEIRATDLCASRDRPQPPRRRRSARRGAVFVDELDEMPPGGMTVFSAHGVAQRVEEVARRARAAGDRCDLPAGRQGALRGAALCRAGARDRADRPCRARRGGRHDRPNPGQGPSGRRPSATSPTLHVPDRRPARLRHADDAVGRRHPGDHRRAEDAVSGDRRAGRARTSAMRRRTASRRCGNSRRRWT